MSRSRKNTPILGNTTCRSEKADKVAWHRRYRRAVRRLLGIDEMLHMHWEFSNPWEMGKDGKRWRDCPRQEWLRK